MSIPDFEALLVDSSRLVADLVVDQVGTNKERMKALYQIACQRNDQTGMRAARAFDLTDEKYPGMASPFLSDIRRQLTVIQHQSVVRCFLRTLMRHPLPEDDEELGTFYELCLSLMIDPKLPVALRYYGMSLAYQTACLLPDLRFELIALYDEVALDSTGGLKGRTKFFKEELIKKFGAE